MDNIIKNLNEKNWPIIKKYIKSNKIDWNILVDQTNGVLQFLAYHNQTKLIKSIDSDTLFEIIAQKNNEDDTICHIAAKLNNIDLFNFVIDINPEIIYYQNKLSYTPLYYLVKNHELIKQIIGSVEIDDHYLGNEYTLLEYYVLDKNPELVSFLLNNIKINKLSAKTLFTIIQSENSNHDKIKLIKMLIDHHIDINTLNHQYLSPLIVAIYQKEYSIIKFLLESGANPNYYGPENNNNPLVIAINKSNIPVIELLLEYDIEVNVRDKYLRTPIHHLFASKNDIPIEIKKILLKKLDNINSVDNKMDSVLNLLIRNDDWHTYSDILQEKKLNIYLKNKDDMRPIDSILVSELGQFYDVVYQSYINQLDSTINWVDNVDKKISSIIENNDDIQSYKNYIIAKIIQGQSYPLKKKKVNAIKLIIPTQTNITHFSAYTNNYICYLYYILDKYSNVKIPMMVNEQMRDKTLENFYSEMTENYKEKTADHGIFRSIIRDYINHSPILINHAIIWKNKETCFFSPHIIQGIKKTIKTYPDTRFILLKLTILSDKNFNHANMIIYDIENKYFERFDPYGNVPFYASNEIDDFLESFFDENFPDTTYLSPAKTSGSISFQIFSDENNDVNYVENDPTGFCVAWCLWYIEMRIKNSDISPKSLIRRTTFQINKNENKFKDYIRNYSNHLDFEKNNILSNADVPKKYWYTRHIPIPIYRAYLKYIRKMLWSIN